MLRPLAALVSTALLSIALTGCGAQSHAKELRAVGAVDLKCDASKLVVEQISWEHGGYSVSGCGQKKNYDCDDVWSKGRLARVCYSAPTNPVDAAKWKASAPLKCEVGKIDVEMVGDAKIDPESEITKSQQHRPFIAKGCGRTKKIGCLPRDVPPWADCYPGK